MPRRVKVRYMSVEVSWGQRSWPRTLLCVSRGSFDWVSLDLYPCWHIVWCQSRLSLRIIPTSEFDTFKWYIKNWDSDKIKIPDPGFCFSPSWQSSLNSHLGGLGDTIFSQDDDELGVVCACPIAPHLPKAEGAGWALEWMKRREKAGQGPEA